MLLQMRGKPKHIKHLTHNQVVVQSYNEILCSHTKNEFNCLFTVFLHS